MSAPEYDTGFTEFASAARSATTNGIDRSNSGARGLRLYFDVTAVTVTQTVQVVIDAKDPLTGKYVEYVAFATVADVDTKVYTILEGATETVAAVDHEVTGLPLPRNFRIRVVHSTPVAFTYSLSGEYLA